MADYQQQRPRLVIADDHEQIAEVCFNYLEPEFEVVSIVSDGKELVEATNELRPDIVILDIAMPYLNGFLAAELINQRLPGVKLVFVTICENAQMADEAFRRGASGYVVKHRIASELAVAVRRVLQGKTFLSASITMKKCPSSSPSVYRGVSRTDSCR